MGSDTDVSPQRVCSPDFFLSFQKLRSLLPSSQEKKNSQERSGQGLRGGGGGLVGGPRLPGISSQLGW